MHYQIGSIELNYDEKYARGTVKTKEHTYYSSNAFELLNTFTDEISGAIRRDMQKKLESSGYNKYTGVPN